MSQDQADYVAEALEMMGKGYNLDPVETEFVSAISGFTPAPDVISKDCGFVTSLVWGRVWRYCQMADGVCRASLSKIADGLGMSERTVIRHLEILCDCGYLFDTTPDLRNKPHIYADTGKIKIRFSGEVTMTKSQCAMTKSQRQGDLESVEESIKKPINKKSPLSFEDIQQVNNKVDAMIANSAKSDWQGRETFRPDHYPLVDWYHTATGQVCPKSKQKDWHLAVSNWTANGLTVGDLQAAYDMDIKWRGVFTSPNQLTDKAIALKAKGSAKPTEKPSMFRTINS